MASVFDKTPLSHEQETARTTDAIARLEQRLAEAEARGDTVTVVALRDCIARRKARLRE